jgi:Flp pilus assembly pilin Flp
MMIKTLTDLLASLGADDHGSSATEYGMLVAAIAVSLATIMFSLGAAVQETFFRLCSTVNTNLHLGQSCAKN